MTSQKNIDAMSVKELKAFIERQGWSHKDCKEKTELRQRAKEAESRPKQGKQAAKTANAGTSSNSADEDFDLDELSSGSGEGTRKRKSKTGTENSQAHDGSAFRSFEEKAAALVAESGKFNGRGADEILKEAKDLREAVMEAKLEESCRKEIIDKLDNVHSSLAFEDNLEKNCGRIIQIGVMALTFLPMLVSILEGAFEFAMRPELVMEHADLFNMHAVVTGGCGALGLELAIMLANSGAGVIVACHSKETTESHDIDSRLDRLGLLRGSGRQEKGWVEQWHLQLESFESVREFATRVKNELGTLDMLVHNAATKEGCRKTDDGHDLAMQVNYLSPFLLTELLLPILKMGSARVVHVTCDAGLQLPDYLPWPLRRTDPDSLPRIDIMDIEQGQAGEEAAESGECSPLAQYAKSKLALLVHSHELNRRMSGYLNRGVSHAVNPGTMDSAFGSSASAPSAKPSMRSSMMSKLPPVWIANQVYSYTLGPLFSKLSGFLWHYTLRKPQTGASAVFHVATAKALGHEESGGGLYADTAGAFVNCGKPAEECGRIKAHKQPAVARDDGKATVLWNAAEQAIGDEALRPLPGK